MEVAKIITQQIGNKALTMIGAKALVATENSLRFQVGRNSKKVTHVIIKLNANDYYDVEFLKVRGLSMSQLALVKDVDFEMLNKTIELNTGMATSL